MYTTPVLSASTTTTAALMLPSTGSNRAMALVALVSLVVSAAVLVSSTARLVAKRAYKA